MEIRNIFKYSTYPTEVDLGDAYATGMDSLDKLKLQEVLEERDLGEVPYSTLEVQLKYVREQQWIYWVKEFNNKAFDLKVNYVMLMHFHKKNIPDKEYYPKHGTSFFTDFDEEHFVYHYWFNHYSEAFYTKLFSLEDAIAHLINLKYNIQVKEDGNFNKNIMGELKNLKPELYENIKEFRRSKIYKEANNFRNNLVHNFRPNQIDSGIENRGSGSYFVGKKKYTTTKEFIKNIEDSIELFADFIRYVDIQLNSAASQEG